jgi:hypothetical protein
LILITYSASDVVVSIDALIETTGSVGLGVRVQQGGCGDNYAAGGYFFFIDNTGKQEQYERKNIQMNLY